MKTDSGMYISKNRLIAIGVLWLLITLAVGLMAGLLSTHACSDEVSGPGDDDTTTPSDTTTPTTTTNVPGPDEPWMNPFLPDLIKPTHYELWFYPDFYFDGDTFQGRENVTISVGEETNYLLIHYKYMNITDTRVWGEDGEDLAIIRAFSYDENQYWVVELEESLTEGSVVTLHLEFEGSLVNGIVGYYKSTYVNAITNEESWLATTKFQPTDARKAFPNFDEPKFKANFTVTLHHWRNFTALSNMPVEVESDLDDLWMETSFQTSYVMSSYLVCFIVCDFEYKENTLENGKPNRIYASPDKINQTDYALYLTKKLTDYMEEEFDMEFPLPKIDHFAVPDYPSGATEHWGLITYRERYLLFDDVESSESHRKSVADIIAHELAHNYFGNLVTCEWWNDIWLNEGFATYYEDIALTAVGEYELADDEFVVKALQPIMESDAEAESRAITENVTHPDEINAAFSGVVYSKGAAILRMIEKLMGSEAFRRAIRTYLKRHEFSTVTTDDLWQALSEETPGIDMAAAMNPWVEQMGLPVVNISQIEDSRLRATQERFLNDPNATIDQPPSLHNYLWYIPLTYRTDSENFTAWMNKSNVEIDDPRPDNGWLQANIKQFGYYRVNYEYSLWQLLAEELRTRPDSFAPVDRAAILDDAFNLARASKLDYPTVLNLTSYMSEERHYFPWKSSNAGFSYISVMLYSTGDYYLWREYMREITDQLMEELGVRDDSDDYLEIVNRDVNIIPLSCGHGNTECLQNTTRLFLEWISDSEYFISPNIRSGAYKYGMRHSGGDEIWETTWERYLQASGDERSNLAYCLAQTTRTWLIQRYLDYAMDPNLIRQQDFFSVVNYMGNNPHANRYVWDWTRANYDTLVERFGTHDRNFGRMVPNIVYYYNTEFQLQEVLDFYDTYPDAGAGAQARAESLASIQSNIAWMKRNKEPIIEWLKKRQPIR